MKNKPDKELIAKSKILVLSILVLGMLAVPLASVHADKFKDPTVTATHTGGNGGGDGDVIFSITNVNDNNGIVQMTVTETDNNQNQIRNLVAQPSGWVNQGLIFQNGKAVQTTWQTCVAGSGCVPVTIGTTLGGFDVKMVGQAPYGWSWVLTDTTGATFSGMLNVPP